GVIVWDAVSGKERLRLPWATRLVSLDVSPDGTTLAFIRKHSTDEAWGLLFWDIATDKKQRFLASPDIDSGHGIVRFSRNGQRVAVAVKSPELRVLVLDVLSGRVLAKFSGFKAVIEDLSFSPDG